MAHDILIRGGTIIDGSGAPRFRGDLALAQGRIAAVGEVDGAADHIIDAAGLVVCPGFIDLHTHYDAQVTWDPLCTPSCDHGTTTVVMGNCGYAVAPVRARDRDYSMGMFSCVEGVSKHTLASGLPWEWETQPQYLDWLRRRGLGLNVAAQVGHSAVRRFVLGPAAHERTASGDEIAEMEQLVREGLGAGAIGFTTSRVAHQKGEQGEPIPSFVAAEEEMFTLACVLRDLDRGIIGINPRTKAQDFNQEDREQLVRLARASGRVVTWNEFNQRSEYPDQWRSLLDFMESAQRQGARVYAVMRCQRLDVHFNLRDTNYLNGSSGWREFMGLSHQAKLDRLGQAETRKALSRELETLVSQSPGFFARTGVAVAASARNRPLVGRLLSDVAAERSTTLGDLFLELLLEEQLETEFAFLRVTNDDDEAVATMLKSPATITGISDAGAHLHTFCGADYPTYFLARWIREKQVLPLEQGVRSLTSLPAELAGLHDRGLLRVGAAADVCIFDPQTVA
ncbi:MAG: amidohydrolase family protein, partial [Deltaproteobacteria bacterium]|nr:amidohydrolase family protein [Deltaproteobacteria bacterium]